jgi:hypothetical protein
VGTHRRISERAVIAKIASAGKRNPANDGAQQSLWLHVALISHLIHNPEIVIGKARANLARGRTSGAVDTHSEPYAREWDEILGAGVGNVIQVLLDPSDHAATLRSNTPFTGVLPQGEVRAIKAAWRQARDTATAV